MTVDAQFLAEFADRWLVAWNSHCTEQVLDLLAPDIRWDDRTFWPEVIVGPMLEQLGGLPPRGDRLGGAYLMSLATHSRMS